MSNHRKRKNSGLLYEFLVRVISQALVEGDTQRSTVALKVLKKHFKPGTELYKEFRLINALVRTAVSSEHVAANILSEAKIAARTHNVKILDEEKNALLRDVARSFQNDDAFFDYQIDDYKTYATAQTLLNEWRRQSRGTADLSQIAQYEDVLIRSLTTPKIETPDELMNNESAGTNRLLMRVMMKKLHEKYDGVLTSDQKTLIKAYALADVKNNHDIITRKLAEIKENVIVDIDNYMRKNSRDVYVVKKLTEARSQIENENTGTVDDDAVTRFLLYVKLRSELTSEE